MPELLDFFFRPSARFRLARLDQLADFERDTLKDLEKDPDFYGVLLSEEPSLTPKAVSRDTALLLYSLGDGSPVPQYFRRAHGDAEARIRELVTNGVIEIKLQGSFVSGAKASGSLRWYGTPDLSNDAVSRLTVDAIRYAERLDLFDATALSARLYFYNRLPMTAESRLKYRAERKVRNILALGEQEAIGAQLSESWSEVRLTPPNDGWLMWQFTDGERLDSNTQSIFKLYISPTLDELPEVFAATTKVLTEVGAPRFKVGKNVFGLLRPDKIVAYFATKDHLDRAAGRLEEEIGTASWHGVPFSASLNGGGLLSWGVDPPKFTKALSWQETETWRLWLTNRIAVALLQARSDGGGGLPPWKFALQSLERQGVDVKTWTLSEARAAEGVAR